VRAERIDRDFFARPVAEVARDLLGCELLVAGVGGRIVETEAYGQHDPACHAYGGRTDRNAPLFEEPGRAYVYLSYGIHHLLNFVAEPEGSAAAVLIRAVEPLEGLTEMRRRRGRADVHELCSGPGKVGQALGVDLTLNRAELGRSPFSVTRGLPVGGVVTSPRVGISRATEIEWRFSEDGSRFVSRPRPQPWVEGKV